MRVSQIVPPGARVGPSGTARWQGIVALFTLLSALVAHRGATLGAQQRPDIVLIQTDDQPYHTLPFMPITDSLIGRKGTRFERYLVSTSLCGPSRATTLTGQYSHNHGVLSNANAASLLDATNTLAVWLSAAGYRTALVGKYLNKYDALFPTVPPGWSYWRAFKETLYWNFELSEDGVPTAYDSSAANYSTYVLRNHAVRFIESTPAGSPLFLYFTPFAPHMPAEPALEDAGSASGLPAWTSPNYNEADVSDKPLWVRQLAPADDQKVRQQQQDIVESLQAIDRAVAAIVKALHRSGRLQNTVIIFTSDNGWALGAHRWTQKRCAYEECSREPLLVRGPGIARGAVVGKTKLADNADLAATIVDYAGVTPTLDLDGRSLRPLLENPAVPWGDPVLLEQRGHGPWPELRFYAIRTKNFMYGEYDNGDRELYDMAADPWQLENVVADPAYAAVVADLTSRLSALKAE